MRIDVFSDPVCPWCFIGKRRMERALAQRGLERDVTIQWRAFQLNPGMPAEGMPRKSYLALKFGGEERARQIYEMIGAAGNEEGIRFAFDSIGQTPNTVNAHRLIRLAAMHGRSDSVVEALFRAYFLQGRDIGDTETLVAIAVECGLDSEETRILLASDDYRSDVLAEHDMAVSLNISGVPCFILEGRYAVVGAQQPDAFMPVFDLVKEEARQGAES